jgi:hypothetical protein
MAASQHTADGNSSMPLNAAFFGFDWPRRAYVSREPLLRVSPVPDKRENGHRKNLQFDLFSKDFANARRGKARTFSVKIPLGRVSPTA